MKENERKMKENERKMKENERKWKKMKEKWKKMKENERKCEKIEKMKENEENERKMKETERKQGNAFVFFVFWNGKLKYNGFAMVLTGGWVRGGRISDQSLNIYIYISELII